MVEIQSYSIDELVELTGVNSRTIAYYIKLGLLPKVGRRGRRTRYPQLFVSRLKFIERVKAMQDTGLLSTVTLPEIARVIWHLVGQSGDEPDFAHLSDREIYQLLESGEIPEKRFLGETNAGKSVIACFGPFGPYVRAGEEDGDPSASIDADEVNSITFEDALTRIKEAQADKQKRLIKEFKDVDIQILDGPYGPYVRHRGVNAKIPKDLDPTKLNLDDCESLIEEKRHRLVERKASKRRDRLSARMEDSVEEESYASYVAESAAPWAMRNLESRADESIEIDIGEPVDVLMRRKPVPDRLILEIERQVREGRRGAERRTETWTRAPITENIEISVQGVDPEQAELVDSLAQRIRKLLGVD